MKSTNKQVAKATFYTSVAVLLAACGGGGGGSSTTSSGSTSQATPTLSGTVATGAPVSGANVTVTDSTGKSVTATADAKGNYQVSLTGLTAPFAVFATDPAGIAPPLASVVASALTNSSAPVIANVTTLTTAAAALVTSGGNPLDLTDNKNLSSLVTLTSVSNAVKTLNSATSNILSANNIDAKSFDPIATPFNANQTGADAVLDAVQVVPAHGLSGGFQLISIADANSSANLTLNSSAKASTPLPVPPVTGGALGTTVSALAQCLVGNSASCSQAIDAKYKENGFGSFVQAHPALAASGVKLGTPQVLEAIHGTDGSQQALITLPYTTSGGASGTEYTVAKLTSSGWNIIGNQQQYNVTIQSFIQRRQSPNFDYKNQTPVYATPRYESGISITIPLGAAGTPNPANFASASVTGPGIIGALYLVPPTLGSGKNTMSLAQAPQTTVPTGNLTSATQNQGYRWSWQSLPGVTATFQPSPSNMGSKYAAQPIDVSTVPQYATYTVTFYDASGSQIGQTSVMNTTPNYAASDGASIAWQNLSNDTLNAFLSANGSQSGAQASVTLAWSNLINGQNVAPLVTQAELTSQYLPSGSYTASNTVGYWNGPATYATSGQYSAQVTAGVDQTGTQQCTSACSFSALQPGTSRNVDLYSNVGLISADNHWDFSE